MATKNDITGDSIISKQPSESYRDGWDRIFGKKKQEPTECEHQEQGRVSPESTVSADKIDD